MFQPKRWARQRHLGRGLLLQHQLHDLGLALHCNGSSWTGTIVPRPAVSGPGRGWAAGINGTDQALVLSHG